MYVQIAGTAVPYSHVSGTSNITTSSSTFSTMSGLTVTPAAGTYIVILSVDIAIANDGSGEVQIAVAGTGVVDSQRVVDCTTAGLLGANVSTRWSAYTQTVLTVDGTQAVTGQFRSIENTVTVVDRSLLLVRV